MVDGLAGLEKVVGSVDVGACVGAESEGMDVGNFTGGEATGEFGGVGWMSRTSGNGAGDKAMGQVDEYTGWRSRLGVHSGSNRVSKVCMKACNGNGDDLFECKDDGIASRLNAEVFESLCSGGNSEEIECLL